MSHSDPEKRIQKELASHSSGDSRKSENASSSSDPHSPVRRGTSASPSGKAPSASDLIAEVPPGAEKNGAIDDIGAGYAYRKPVERVAVSQKPKAKFDLSSQGSLVLGGILVCIIILLGIVGRCNPRDDRSTQTPIEFHTVPKTVVYGNESVDGVLFTGIESTRKVNDPDLVSEITELIKSQELPHDVFAGNIDESKDVAAVLNRNFEFFVENNRDFQKLASEIPVGDWTIPADALRKVDDILNRNAIHRNEIRQVLELPDAAFGFDFVETEDGPVPNPDTPDMLRNYMILEEYAVAHALAVGDLLEAVESLKYIFRIAELSSRLPNIAVRVRAVQIRQKGLNILQTLLLDRRCGALEQGLFLEFFTRTLAHWPKDGVAWNGERARGMQVYEWVRRRGLEDVLDEAAIADLERRGVLDRVLENLPKTLNGDQVYYLKAMKFLIAECTKPYYQRTNALRTITDELQSVHGKPEEPVVAGFLLGSVRQNMQTQAVDRAQIEACVIALSLAGGLPEPPHRLEPIFGKPYQIDRGETRIHVAFHSSVKPFIVPVLPTAQKTETAGNKELP